MKQLIVDFVGRCIHTDNSIDVELSIECITEIKIMKKIEEHSKCSKNIFVFSFVISMKLKSF